MCVTRTPRSRLVKLLLLLCQMVAMSSEFIVVIVSLKIAL